jgi:hypothetical protein
VRFLREVCATSQCSAAADLPRPLPNIVLDSPVKAVLHQRVELVRLSYV